MVNHPLSEESAGPPAGLREVPGIPSERTVHLTQSRKCGWLWIAVDGPSLLSVLRKLLAHRDAALRRVLGSASPALLQRRERAQRCRDTWPVVPAKIWQTGSDSGNLALTPRAQAPGLSLWAYGEPRSRTCLGCDLMRAVTEACLRAGSVSLLANAGLEPSVCLCGVRKT